MLAITYGPIYKPKLEVQEYDVTLEDYSDEEAAEAMYELLRRRDEDVYIEEGRAYVPMFRNYMFTSVDYTFVFIPRSKGLNIYVPKSKLDEFVEILSEYITTGGSLKGFVTGRLKDQKIPYLYPMVALYYDKYLYLYLNGVEVALPR